ncbi:MAG: hypothetical protein ABSG79_16020 [Bryobacteraceae bacterium]|jgi:hypothetical protein
MIKANDAKELFSGNKVSVNVLEEAFDINTERPLFWRPANANSLIFAICRCQQRLSLRLPARLSGAASWRLPEGVSRILIVVGPVPLGLSKFGTLLAHISTAHASGPWFGISRNPYCF